MSLTSTSNDPTSIAVVTGEDGKQYEVRIAMQHDTSIIHHSDPKVADNEGWRRQMVNGQWTGHMVRPAK